MAVLATDGVSRSSLHIICEMIRLADAIVGERTAALAAKLERPWQLAAPLSLTMKTVSVDGMPVTCAAGETLKVDGSLAESGFLELLVLPSASPFRAKARDHGGARGEALTSLIGQRWRDGALIAAAGSSIFHVARSGILDGRVATISAEHQPSFRLRFPAVRLDPSSRITEDSNIFCAASLDAEIGLACKLISLLTANWVGETAARLCMSNLTAPILPPIISHAKSLATNDNVVSQAALWIARNYSQRLQTAELAANLSVSENTLIRRFQRAMQTTPHGYMRELRLDVAARNLRNTSMPVSHIASRVGYSAVPFFKRIFEKQYGLSPIAYRRAMRAAKEAASVQR